MARICLISPGHLSTNPRLVKEALALQAVGHDVHVVHGSFKPWGTENDKLIAAELGSTRALSFGPSEATRLTYLRQTLTTRAARTLATGRGRIGPLWAGLASSPVAADLYLAASSYRAELYIAHYVAALPAAAHAAKRFGGLFAFDAEDFHLGDLPDSPENALEKRIINAVERRYLSRAAFVTAASPMIAEAYAETYSIPLPMTVLNVFPRSNAPLAPTPKGVVEPGPSLYWFSQTIGPGRGIETALEAIARAKSRPHLYLRGTPAVGYADYLRGAALKGGVTDRLHLLEPSPPGDLERLGSAYDLGFVGELAITTNRQIALTNKLFSYLLGGVPSLASAIPAHCRIAPDLGAAIILYPIDDPAALAAAIDAMLLDPARLAAARAHAWHLGQDRYNWEIEQKKLADFVGRNLSAASES
jgi:glycosyltransferase involved in cell wall biosynthesis